MLKSEQFADTTEGNEKSADGFHARFAEYHELLRTSPLNQFNVTKNNAAIRNAIVNSAIKGLALKICKFCSAPLR